MGQMDKRQNASDVAVSTSEVTPEGVAKFVDRFYAKVRSDPELEYVIDNAIAGDWAGHLQECKPSGRPPFRLMVLTKVIQWKHICGSREWTARCSFGGWRYLTTHAGSSPTSISPMPFA